MIHAFHVPSSMQKLTLPKHTSEGLDSEVSSARVPSWAQERRGAAARDLVPAQMVLQPWTLGAAAWVSPVYKAADKTGIDQPMNRNRRWSCKGGGCPESAVFPSQHCSCCLCFSGVRLAPHTGPSAMRPPWSLLVFLSLVWLKAVPTFSESELWTKQASACHPGFRSLWLLWILLTEPGLEVRCEFFRLPETFKKSQLNLKKKEKRKKVWLINLRNPTRGSNAKTKYSLETTLPRRNNLSALCTKCSIWSHGFGWLWCYALKFQEGGKRHRSLNCLKRLAFLQPAKNLIRCCE